MIVIVVAVGKALSALDHAVVAHGVCCRDAYDDHDCDGGALIVIGTVYAMAIAIVVVVVVDEGDGGRAAPAGDMIIEASVFAAICDPQ